MKKNLRYEKGFTFIEMLISFLLASILMGGMVKIFSDNKSLSLMHNDLNNIQLEGLQASLILANDIRNAGIDFNLENNYSKSPLNWDKTNSYLNDSDTISFVYQNFDNFVDCDGNNTTYIENHYYVLNNILYCNSNELLDNVEVIKFLYGVDLDQDNIADRYVTAEEAETLSNSELNKIIEIKFSFLLKGNVLFGEKTTKNINLLGIYSDVYEDSYNYRIFTRNILMKNMM